MNCNELCERLAATGTGQGKLDKIRAAVGSGAVPSGEKLEQMCDDLRLPQLTKKKCCEIVGTPPEAKKPVDKPRAKPTAAKE